MTPVTPIVPGEDLDVTVYAKNQPQYQPLPVWLDLDGATLSRWRLTWWERLCVLVTGDVYLWVLTFNKPLQPVKLQVFKPKVVITQSYERVGADGESTGAA